MADYPTPRTRMTHVALRISSSSPAHVPSAHFTGCVLDLLGYVRPRVRAAGQSTTGAAVQ